MATYRIVAGVGLLSAVLGLACSDSVTEPSDSQIGPVRSLTLSVTPDRLPNPGPVTIDLRAITDPGMRVAPDAVRLVLVINGRETVDPAELDETGQFTQRIYLATSTIVRATSGSIVVERTVSIEATPAGVPPTGRPAADATAVPRAGAGAAHACHQRVARGGADDRDNRDLLRVYCDCHADQRCGAGGVLRLG